MITTSRGITRFATPTSFKAGPKSKLHNALSCSNDRYVYATHFVFLLLAVLYCLRLVLINTFLKFYRWKFEHLGTRNTKFLILRVENAVEFVWLYDRVRGNTTAGKCSRHESNAFFCFFLIHRHCSREVCVSYHQLYTLAVNIFKYRNYWVCLNRFIQKIWWIFTNFYKFGFPKSTFWYRSAMREKVWEEKVKWAIVLPLTHPWLIITLLEGKGIRLCSNIRWRTQRISRGPSR